MEVPLVTWLPWLPAYSSSTAVHPRRRRRRHRRCQRHRRHRFRCFGRASVQAGDLGAATVTASRAGSFAGATGATEGVAVSTTARSTGKRQCLAAVATGATGAGVAAIPAGSGAAGLATEVVAVVHPLAVSVASLDIALALHCRRGC